MRLLLRPWKSRLILGTAIVLFAQGSSGRADDSTAIGKLAATIKPGEWAELKSAGYDQATLMRGDDILAYSGKAAWDRVSQQVLFIGQVHLKGPPVFIAYSATDNAWRRMPTPKWAEPLKWFHAYENNAADSARGVFYHHSSASGLVHQYVVSKEKWSTLAELKAPTGHGTALEYFPEMKGLVAYMSWLSAGIPRGADVVGRGFARLERPPNVDSDSGKNSYGARCATCHGLDGSGRRNADGSYAVPPLWGPRAFNIGAGMARLDTAAAFVHQNMPLGQPEKPTTWESYDIAAYFTEQHRPDFAGKSNDWPRGGKPRDARY